MIQYEIVVNGEDFAVRYSLKITSDQGEAGHIEFDYSNDTTATNRVQFRDEVEALIQAKIEAEGPFIDREILNKISGDWEEGIAGIVNPNAHYPESDDEDDENPGGAPGMGGP